jgi:threonine/homoserine/homoserine lactone efflux protein
MIVDIHQLSLFIPAALALNLTPGNDMLFCLGQGLKSGPAAGVAASLGVATGSLVHSLTAALGLAALLAANPLAFGIIRWAGIGYLVWLAIQSLRNPLTDLTPAQAQTGTLFRAWRDGVFVNILNPKIALFILALIPQFVDPTKGSTFLQFLLFGAILNVGGTIINGLVGGYAGRLGRLLAKNVRAARAFQIATAAVFLALAARLVVS